MRITCVLPGWVEAPSGGFKVIYQIANRLAARGHRVVVLHPDETTAGAAPDERRRRRQRPRAHGPAAVQWFQLRPDVEVRRVPDLSPRHLPDADSLLATGWATAKLISQLPARCGRQFFYVQDYEHWLTGGERQRRGVEDALRIAPSPIAPSQGALEMLATVGRTAAAQAPLGMELDDFGVDVRPEERDPLRVGFPLRQESFKASVDAVLALGAVRGWIPDLSVESFGAWPRPQWLPPWVEYSRSPGHDDLRRFYNRLAVFLLPSRAEGWSLVAAEAMRCAAALVTATWGRLAHTLRDGEVARMVPAGRSDLMARAVEELIRCHRHRCELARAGARATDDFGWEPSVDMLERLLGSTAGPHPC